MKGIKLGKDHAEFFFNRARDGRLEYRVGFVARVPNLQGKTVLLLDYDRCSRPNWREIRKRLNRCSVPYVQSRFKMSPGRRGWHCILIVGARLQPIEIVALQAILESDPNREAENFKRARILSPKEFKEFGNVLFKKTKG